MRERNIVLALQGYFLPGHGIAVMKLNAEVGKIIHLQYHFVIFDDI